MLLRGKRGGTDCPADVEEIHCASCWEVWARQAQLPLGKAMEATSSLAPPCPAPFQGAGEAESRQQLRLAPMDVGSYHRQAEKGPPTASARRAAHPSLGR